MSSHRRVLYVDDNQDSREMVSFMLRYSNLNCEIISVDSAESAISLIARQTFDFYILDYALPEMSGIELCREIRKSDPTTPILFFTAMAREIDRLNGLKAGANEYLIKPNDLNRLTKTVERLLAGNLSVLEIST